MAILARHLIQDFPDVLPLFQHALVPVPRPDDPEPPAHAADLSGRGRAEDRLHRGVRLQRRHLGDARRRAADRRGARRRPAAGSGTCTWPPCSTRGSSGWACPIEVARHEPPTYRIPFIGVAHAAPLRAAGHAGSGRRGTRGAGAAAAVRPRGARAASARAAPGRAAHRVGAADRRTGHPAARRTSRGPRLAYARELAIRAAPPGVAPRAAADRARPSARAAPGLTARAPCAQRRFSPRDAGRALARRRAAAHFGHLVTRGPGPRWTVAATRDGSRSTRRRISPACAPPADSPPRRSTT